MVRETRHLWVGNLPENIREDRIREHFKRYVVQLYHCKHCQQSHNVNDGTDPIGYGRVQSVRLLPRTPEEKTGEVQMACTVAFMDIKSAAKAHNAEPKIDDRTLSTKYYEPAAIPSAAAPHSGTPPPYSTSTSPGATRFPNGHGSSDEHGFPESTGDTGSRSFYDRPSGGVGAAPTAAPEGGSGTCRGGRNRDRFRGGGGPRGAPSVWGNSAAGYADTSRYNNSNERSQSDTTGYSSAPSSDTNDRRNTDGVRKKAKSRSGSRSPSPNGSTSTRSPSRSRSHSSSSSSSSSTSRDTSSTSSRHSRRHRRHYKKVNAQPNSASSAPSGDRRPLGIRVSNLPIRSSDTSLKDGLFHEYKKHGKVTWVNVVGQNENRHAIVCFKKPEDAEKALEVSYDKLFFGCKIEVEPHAVCEIDEVDCRYESEVDEYNPKATRTLFIGNLEKDVTASDLRKHFDQFGEIIEIDIKKQGAVSSYAFCQYADIVSVVKAIRKMDGEHLGTNRIKLGFGKSMAYNCVWIDGVAETVTEKYLRIQFEQFGTVTKCVIDRDKGQALVFYEHVTQAQMAVSKMRGFLMKNAKLQVDFASRECQECFFERLEKQGATLEPRTAFTEERRDSSSRSFESTAPSRVSRYDTPTRPRTSSYSSRSSAAAVASPGTPGSATPRGCRDRPRYYGYDLEYAVTLEGAARHAASHRSYDEYSQGSAASHDDPYDPFEHTVAYLHDSPGHAHLDPLEVRMVPSLVDPVAYGPHDIRNLQKERVHLLEQLEECPSSGDELICPKKRLKLDLLDPAVGDVIIETNRDHNRKVMEVRRLSETTLRHHSRRPSVDTSKYAHYAPHTVGCKRRRTGGSDGGTRSGNHTHYGEHSDGSDPAGSRPGTPLCDENPEFPPGEPPKRTTRERGEAPMVLPLPKWAAQVRSTPEFQRGTITVAGIKGQKEPVNNPLASPPPAATASPRVPIPQHAPRPPSPLPHVPPPASPPPRPPSLSSNSSDSDGATGSPSLEERIKSLDEKYEKWSGSRALSAAGNDALAVLDANREKFRLRHKLLEIQDLKEVQPSEIVKSMMAKRSVFDEDLKRLESVGEKYEPKDFGIFCNRLTTSVSGQSSGSTTPASSVGSTISSLSVMAPALKLTTSVSTPQAAFSCPRSTGTTIPIPVSRGLQYPFPSHPPMQMAATQPTMTSTVPSTPLTPPITSSSTTTVTARNPNLGENRLKSTANVPGDSRTSSVKNRSVAPVVSDVSSAVKPVKPGEKVTLRRNSSSTSPRADVKTRRNSDTSARRIDDKTEEQRLAEKTKEEAERLKREQEELDRLEKERVEREKQEKERLERERKEKERLERESELEKQRLENERLEKERQQREKEKERERERARLEKERLTKLEKEKEEREKREREERERQEAKEREEREQKAKEEQLEKERRRNEDRARNKDSTDNHHERSKHRENHSESTTKHRQNNSDKHQIKEEKTHRDEYSKRDGYRERDLFQETAPAKHENLKNQMDREAERRKESIKENRDNNIHDKTKHLNETKERASVETRHMSLDLDGKMADSNRRKERNNSLPANVGLKRRMSSHETLDPVEEPKKVKLHDHKKMSERRDSKDSSKGDKKSSKHKNNSLSNSHSDERRKDKEREERHKYKHKLEKQKSKSKSQEKEDKEPQQESQTPPDSSMIDKDFLAKLNLRSNEDIEKEKLERQKKEPSKERRHKDQPDQEKRQEKTHSEKTPDSNSKKDQGMKSPQDDKHKSNHKKENRIRKVTNSSDSESGDEPKKQHSIFDIVDDGPPYISMYDKVKARSCKNMQKQEEEKRQEKIKAKFSQLKLSRARREEKKRSTSWDEDSDSDKDTEIKSRRSRKLLDSSDESQERKTSHKKKDSHYSDSDNSLVLRGHKTEPLESSDEDVKVKHLTFKGSKSKIASDSSDDEYHKTVENNSEYRHEKKFFENDTEVDQLETKPEKLTTVKNELERLVKKERRNSKFQELTCNVEHQSFDSLHSDTPVKTEKFNNRPVFDNTTDEEPMEFKKEKSEKREKKHKKKQKKQKHSASSEESCKLETDLSLSDVQEKKHHEKRKEHSKKDKKRDKTKESRDKSKKTKKSKSDSKREGKLENIFGSLSEDSEAGTRDQKPEFLVDENAQAPPTYNTDSDKEFEKQQQEERDREAEHKRKKEKKRREKERRLQEAAAEEPSNPTNESSMDFADMCKQLEANIKDDTSEMEFKPEIVESSNVENENIVCGVQEVKKENKEKKKKRKKSKDEKKHHHHHHHHDKSKAKTPEVKSEDKEPLSISIPEVKVEDMKEESSTPNQHHQSLPSLDDIITEKTPEFMVSPGTRDMVPLISPIPKTPTTSKTKREKLIPGFGTAEVDENAIKSISVETEPTVPTPEIKQEVKEELKEETGTESPGEKPRVVISQEETEDAVAALLGESFGSSQFEERYTEEITTTIEEPPPELVEEPNVQDDEEMRKAVQSLEVEGEISKPETPPSDDELQIDTDTEEQDEPPEVKPAVVEPVVYKPPTSPPSLTPIKPITETKKVQEEVKLVPEKRTVIAQVWPAERKPDLTVMVPPVEVKQIPTIKVTEPNFPPLAKLSPVPEPKPAAIVQATPVVMQPQQQQTRHNLPARLPPVATKTIEAPKSPSGGVILNRLPITPVPGPKPLQATTMLLPQPKVAHSSEPPKLSDIKQDPRPRMVFHQPPFIPFATPAQPPRMVLQPNPLLRPINATNYNMYMARSAKLVPLEVKETPVRSEISVKESSAESRPPNNILLVPVVPQVVANAHKSPSYILAENPKPVSVITSESSMKPEDVRSKVPVPEEPLKAETVTPPVEVKQQLKNVTEPLHLSLPIVETRTSTPSPVIVANPEVKCEPPQVSPVKPPIEKPTEPDTSSSPKEEEKAATPEPIKIEPVVAVVTEPDPPKEEPVKEEPAPQAPAPAVEKQIEEPCEEEPKLKVDLETPTGDPKEDEFWSAKDSVNIESVIKTLGSADELSDTENNKPPVPAPIVDTINNVKSPEKNPEPKPEDEDINEEGAATEPEDEQKQEVSVTRSSTRRGRGGRTRGTKAAKAAERGGIQTRRGKLKEAQAQTPAQSKRGRGGKVRSERKSSKSESESTSTNDVYEFRDDSDDSNKEQRPRLVLTIKSTTSSTSNAQTTTIVKEITKDGAKEIGKEVKATPPPKELIVASETIPAPPEEPKDEFTSPQTGNTRKSRRLAEKDISRNTVDDTIEDVIKNTPLTRSAANQRRSGRQLKKPAVVGIVESETPRKSPRGRKPNRRPSEAADNSSSEEVKEENNVPVIPPPSPNKVKPQEIQPPPPPQPQPQVEAVKEKKIDHCSPKTTMLKRFKGEMTNSKPEPTNLIDPVTGMLIPMRESEEGKYIPLPGSAPAEKKLPNAVDALTRPELVKTQPSVITQPQQVTVVQQSTPKVHSLKAHVLSSQAAKAVTSELPPTVQSKTLHPVASPSVKEIVPQLASSSAILSKPTTPILISRSGTPVTSVGPLSPRPGVPVGEAKSQVKPPTLSPSQQLLLTNHKHMMQAREQLQHLGNPMAPKQSAQIVNTQLAHLKHHQVIMSGKAGGMTKPHVLVHQQHLPGQITTPPVSKAALQARVMAQSPAKGVIEPPKVDVSMPSLMLGRPTLSPSAPQTRLAGLPVPGYEASLMADPRAFYNRTSPPPAHQNSPHSPKGEPIHHPLGALRPDLNYMQSHMMYQHYLRQQQHFQRAASMEKSGEEGEEAPVGLTVAGRGAAVPHHSPHDRATESPAIGQVYSTPSARLPYHPGSRYFDQQPAEPPPAHRPLTSHDRAGLPHIPPLGAADRPLGAHSAHLVPDRPTGVIPERPLSAHLAHERAPLSAERTTSTYAPVVGAGLGAAGNLMGAVAKHIGADAPATQRGIQAATPPLASQVPPQAESLCILLKQYPLMWQGLLALKNDQAAVQMYFVSGNDDVAKCSLPKNNDGSTPPLRIFQRMRLEPMQVEGVARKMQMEKEHCMLLALPCGHDHMDVLKQSTNLTWGFITYLQQKQAAGIVNVAAPGTTHPPAYVVHIFPSCDFVNENLRRIAPSLLERVADIAHLLIVITTV